MNTLPISIAFTTHHIDARDGSTFAVYREFTLDSMTNVYRDDCNDVFVSKPGPRKLWEVSSREPGNQHKAHSRHRGFPEAMAAAISIACTKVGDIGCQQDERAAA